MTDNQRKYPRHEIQFDVQLSFQENEPKVVCTRDISEGGMFLEIDDPSIYPLGEMVHLKYKDPNNNNIDTEMDAIIVRVASDGLGIAFVVLDAF
jgi:c-di-GMP-binding flagellar brake protein YcgR